MIQISDEKLINYFVENNNLRHGSEEPEDLRYLVNQVLDHCQQIQNCKVMFCSLIPSIGHNKSTWESFDLFNKMVVIRSLQRCFEFDLDLNYFPWFQ